jgi:ligand-binding sensor domain-containing protein
MRNWLYRLFWLWLSFTSLFSFTARAQEYSYARYDVKDGLAGSVVYCGVEDKDGFLWFGTETGLSRFDGTHFRNFTTVDGLPDNEIIRLFVDSKGRVWIMPFRNSICYYWKGKIYNQQNDSLLRKLTIISQIVDVAEDSAGNILVAEAHGVHIITAAGQVKTVLDAKDREFAITKAGIRHNGHLGLMVSSVGKDPDDVRNAVLTIEPDTYTIVKEITSYDPHLLALARLSPVLETYAKKDSLYFLWSAGEKQSAYPLLNVTGLSPLNDSLCAINAADGTTIFDFRKGQVIRRCLQGKEVNSVMQDSEGNYWFMTVGAGVFRVGSFEFQSFIFSINNRDVFPVFSIQKVGPYLYAGTAGSLLWSIDTGTLQMKHEYLYDPTGHTRISSMTIMPGNRLVLGTNNGLIQLSDVHRKGDRVGTSIKSLYNSVKSLTGYNGQFFLVATIHGVYLGDERLSWDNHIWRGRSTTCLAQGDTVYVGTLNGLYIADSTPNGKFLGDQFPLLQSRIAAMGASADGTLWIATYDNGLLGFRNNRITHIIRQQDGLTSDICRALYVSGNTIWVGTDKGLNRVVITPAGAAITTYTEDDGLVGNMINVVYVDGSKVYAGTSAGLTSFDADRISLHSFCKLRITGVGIQNGKKQYDTTGLVLPHVENDVRFDFVGISYRSAGDITYRYRMVGLNDNWQTTRETFLSYPSLPSGDYELQLQATNKFGVESEIVRIPFQVEKLLWEKTWFRILALLIIGALIWIFVNARIKKIRRQNEEKMQINNRMAELEQMALKAQMNPHFIFNSLNSVQQYVIDKDLRGANKFITDFSRLIRLTLDISSKTKISLYEEISYLTTYLELEKTKFEDKFSYRVTVADNLDPSDWYIPPMILQPYVENSIRHGVRYRADKLGEIRVSMELNEQYLICRVEDNGVGRKVAAQFKSQMPIEYQSKGMTLTARRIEMLNRHQQVPALIEVEDILINNQIAGTRVVLQFPVAEAGKSH